MPKTQMPELRNPPSSLFASTDPNAMRRGRPVYEIPHAKLVPFARHPFRLYTGQKLDDLVESIKINGVLVPIIVRPLKSERYEILSGHNRVNGSEIAELETVPSIIMEGLTDEEALLIVIETNLLQRSFGEMTHSERAAVLSAHHTTLKHQGRRTDLIREVENLLNPRADAGSETLSPVAKKSTHETMSDEYALSKDTVARYLRVNMLIDSLKSNLDDGLFGLRVAVTVSYLLEETQHYVAAVIATGLKLDTKKADALRAAQPHSMEEVKRIMEGATKSTRPAAFKLKPKIVNKYFSDTTTTKEIESTIITALDIYFEMHPKEGA